MTREDHVLVVNVVVTDLRWEIMASNVIILLASAAIKFSAIFKIRKYKGLHEGHHFIMMVVEVHTGVIWIISSRNVPIFSMIDD
jgi:hypothetical protein